MLGVGVPYGVQDKWRYIKEVRMFSVVYWWILEVFTCLIGKNVRNCVQLSWFLITVRSTLLSGSLCLSQEPAWCARGIFILHIQYH